ncbi:Glyoxalase-like domain-containing protein [Enhydrobacter aerosaccus]|uniref:Glyoxalase-like domain-containing protein n=1 Tax=Enhydrobacter aerosaccus TaxID=225324 RepID=A0A1T4KPW8_9HYPH|nr:VOC family protein [Enhydrobacter aerosaccus]SJZ44450.1 Glyoxalase-like domain-containing protein [Enhydrobacter aerosaccus]
MKVSARDIDHLILTAPDPDALAARLQQLGFNATPEGVEPRCLCFQPQRDDIPNYIEIIEGDPGPALAVNVAELEGETREHTWESEDGFEVEGRVVIGQTSGPLPWVAVKHETPEAFMEPEWIVHPNGALALIAIHAVAEDPAALAKILKSAWKAETEEIFDGCVVVKTGAVELLLWSSTAWQLEYKAIEPMVPKDLPAIVGIAVAIERARPLQALLGANNVSYALGEDGRVIVAPEQAGGIAIEFMPQN